MLDSWSLPVLQDPCTITVQFKDSLVPIFCWLFADGFLFAQDPKREDIWLARHLAARWNLLQTFLTAQEHSENSWISAPIDRESLCPAIQSKEISISPQLEANMTICYVLKSVNACMIIERLEQWVRDAIVIILMNRLLRHKVSNLKVKISFQASIWDLLMVGLVKLALADKCKLSVRSFDTEQTLIYKLEYINIRIYKLEKGN